MNLIPKPLSVFPLPGTFCLGRRFVVHFLGREAESVATYLIQEVQNRFGLEASLDPKHSSKTDVSLQILDKVDALENLANRDEGYVLNVSDNNGISVVSQQRAGLFYGVQTLFQLFPFQLKLNPCDVILECVKIVDVPRFQWRGALLDVGRHFFKVSFVKRFLDHLAMYKVNRFHWHLTEDQGWRIEIKSFPKLTEIGSWRSAGDGNEKYGGFYTQSEIREIVSYARERCIEVMPEIEMPGHCGASLAAYPYLCCQENITETPSEWGVYDDVYCAGKDKVLTFLKGVLNEIIELFPFECIHIGGDETPKDRWKECSRCQERIHKQELKGEDELQSWFISQIADYLWERNRKIVGWDEILDGGIPSHATVMSWRGVIGGFIAAKLGHDVIMSPTSHCYLDYKQSDSPNEPGAYYATLTLESVYAFEPIPEAKTLVRGESPDSSDVPGSSQMETSEMSEVTADTAGMELDESQSKVESSQNIDIEDASVLHPERKLADDIHNGRIPQGLTDSEQTHILGGQVNVWTEYIKDEETCEYMLLPRLCAFSEAVWSLKDSKNFTDFYRRLEVHTSLFDVLGFNYRSLSKQKKDPIEKRE